MKTKAMTDDSRTALIHAAITEWFSSDTSGMTYFDAGIGVIDGEFDLEDLAAKISAAIGDTLLEEAAGRPDEAYYWMQLRAQRDAGKGDS